VRLQRHIGKGAKAFGFGDGAKTSQARIGAHIVHNQRQARGDHQGAAIRGDGQCARQGNVMRA
jgi:hypothetical protein